LETLTNNGTAFVTNINYNEKGQRLLIEYGNNTSTEYQYDPNTFRLNRLKTLRTGNSSTLQDLNYTYDPVGNIVEINDNAQETTYYNNAPVEPRKKFTYDALYRILSGNGRELIGLAQASSGGYSADSIGAADTHAVHKYTQQYEYDELGNITKLTHTTPTSSLNWTRNYVYDTATNRLLKHDVNQTLPDYQYDAHGNITQMPHLPAMAWSFKDELKEVTLNAGGDKAYYVYDASGNRALKVVVKGNIREERYYLGDYEVYRKFVSNSLHTERSTVHVSDDKKKIALLEKQTVTEGSLTPNSSLVTRYQYDDHLGSASLELNENADIISYEEYHPFGTTSYLKHNTNISQKCYKYVGKERDEETGLYYYGARYYAAWLCRFVSVDPLQHKYPYYTPYQYAGNKPITFIDLDGLEPMIPPQTEPRDVTNIKMPLRFELIRSLNKVEKQENTKSKEEIDLPTWDIFSETIETPATLIEKTTKDLAQNIVEKNISKGIKVTNFGDVYQSPRKYKNAENFLTPKNSNNFIEVGGLNSRGKFTSSTIEAATKSVKNLRIVGKAIGEFAGPLSDVLDIASALQGKQTPFAIINPISFILDEQLNQLDRQLFEKVVSNGYKDVKSFMESSPSMFEGMNLIYVNKDEMEKIASGEINNYKQLGTAYRNEDMGYSVLVNEGKDYNFSFYAAFNISK